MDCVPLQPDSEALRDRVAAEIYARMLERHEIIDAIGRVSHPQDLKNFAKASWQAADAFVRAAEIVQGPTPVAQGRPNMPGGASSAGPLWPGTASAS